MEVYCIMQMFVLWVNGANGVAYRSCLMFVPIAPPLGLAPLLRALMRFRRKSRKLSASLPAAEECPHVSWCSLREAS
jgi:hypothetical protein